MPGNGFEKNRLERHCSLKQIVMQPTRDTSKLDSIFTNMVDCYEFPVILVPLNYRSRYHSLEIVIFIL